MKEGAILVLVCAAGAIAIIIALAWVVARNETPPSLRDHVSDTSRDGGAR